jgi:hypothetical protein
VNGADDVYVERKGRIERVQGGLFEGEEAVLHVMGWVERCGRGGRFVVRRYIWPEHRTDVRQDSPRPVAAGAGGQSSARAHRDR